MKKSTLPPPVNVEYYTTEDAIKMWKEGGLTANEKVTVQNIEDSKTLRAQMCASAEA